MQFLYPLGLFALASLIFPIIIHLWRVKQEKTLKIGSISLLGESAASNSKSLRISQWLLFLLRCLLLVLLVFLLASPYIAGKTDEKNQTGWILIDAKQLKNSYQLYRKKIDALLKKGYQIHHFGYGFKLLNLKDTANYALQRRDSAMPLNYSSLLKQLNNQLPNQYPVTVFAAKHANQFDQELPIIHLKLDWQDTEQKDSLFTYYTQYLGRTYKASLTKKNVVFKPESNAKMPTIDVLIYPLNNDSKYVKAALAAIGSQMNRNINFVNSLPTGKKIDAIYWLTAKTFDAQLAKFIKPDGYIFKYAQGKTNEKPSLLNGMSYVGKSDQVKFFKSIFSSVTENTYWATNFGNPILTLEQKETYKSYTFYSRLNPKWTDLIWKEAFVKAMIPIVHNKSPTQFGFSPTNQSNILEQEPAAFFEANTTSKPFAAPKQKLDQLIWILAFSTLLIERILTFYSKKNLTSA